MRVERLPDLFDRKLVTIRPFIMFPGCITHVCLYLVLVIFAVWKVIVNWSAKMSVSQSGGNCDDDDSRPKMSRHTLSGQCINEAAMRSCHILNSQHIYVQFIQHSCGSIKICALWLFCVCVCTLS